ncbi:hypothetical protein GH5_05482 [Leishmania sp. Ghana 2012 LV757]|uniref:hypothetical protein n=1 Tax=Leishmania sp. Ghana 2012 LV757 TaxID=2803181 RepID=UPI001B629AB3|nr:hypothetical protein GH5_05482 [Leishmania sp. Ghana 2012 LV757]
MRRTVVSTKGFRAPRASGSDGPSADTAVASSNAAATPPARSASAARKMLARDSTASGPYPSPSSSSAPRQKSSDGGRKTATAAAAVAAADFRAGTATLCRKSGGSSSLQAPRGLLSGHFSANFLRRASQREDQGWPRNSASAIATVVGRTAESTAVTTTAGQHTVAHANRDHTSIPRKRPRSPSPDNSYVDGTQDRYETASACSRAPILNLGDGTERSDDIRSLAQVFIPRVSTARRLTTSHTPRTVFYPPSGVQPASCEHRTHDADVAGALSAPEFSLALSTSSAPVTADFHVASQYPARAHAWGPAPAEPASTGTGDALAAASATDALRAPGHNPVAHVCKRTRSSGAADSEEHMTSSDVVMTGSTATTSTQDGKRFLSAVVQQRSDCATTPSTAPPSLPSSSRTDRSPYCSCASQMISPAPPAVPSTPIATSSASPSPAVLQLRARDLAAASLSSLGREASAPLSSPRLEYTEPPPSPPLADGAPAPAMGLMWCQARASATAAGADGDQLQSVLSRAPPASSVEELTWTQQQQQVPMHLSPVLAAVEEAEREECDEALEREMAEDLRMSTDIAFTPSGTGSGAPPFFSQSSMMEDEEKQVEGDSGEETIRIRGSDVTTLRAGSDSQARGDSRMSGEQGRAHTFFSAEGGAGGLPIAGPSPPPSTAISDAPDQRALFRCGGHDGLPTSTDSVALAPLNSMAEPDCVFVRLPSAPSTWPIREATSPRPPSVLAPGEGVLPLGAAAAAAAGGSGGRGVGGTGPGRHRTTFSFRSLRADTSTATPPPDPFADPQPRPSQSSVATATVETFESPQGVGTPATERASLAASSPDLECSAKAYPSEPRLLSALPSGYLSPPRGPEPISMAMEGAKGEGCCAQDDSLVRVVAPTSTPPPWKGTLLSPSDRLALLSRGTAPLLSDSYVAAQPQRYAAAGSSSVTALPARPGRTCFTLHSAVPIKATASSSAAAIAEAAAPGVPAGVAPLAGTGTSYPPGEDCSYGSCSAELQQLTGRCAVLLQRAAAPAAFVEGAATATPSNATRTPSCTGSSHTTVCAREPVGSAQPAVPLPLSSAPATVALPRTPSAPTGEESARSRQSPLPQQTRLPPPTAATTERQQFGPPHKDSHPPATLTVAAVMPFMDGTNAEVPIAAAPQPTPAAVAHDEAAHLHPREGRGMLSPVLLAPSQPPSPPFPHSAAADDTAGLFYGLPREVGHFYAARRGITSLYDWQHHVLTCPEVQQGGNFVYSLPTSGGKTLVAELSLLRCALNRRKSCFLVLPFVSLAEEKTMALQPLAAAFDFIVEGHYGSSGRFPLSEAPAVYVCTIEKANSLLNHLLEEGRADEVGAVVVDELHMVGEPRRGATLELFLSKLLMISAARQRQCDSVDAPASQRCGSASGAPPGQLEEEEHELEGFHPSTVVTRTAKAAMDPGPLQIIGMSATVPNLRTLAEWLRASCFECDFRPVPLRAYSVVGGLVLRDGRHNERNLSSGSVTEHLIELATEVPGASVLVFCASRQQCVDTAKGIVNYLRAQAIAGEKMSPAWMAGDGDESAESQPVSVLGVPFPTLAKGPATVAAVAAVPSQTSLAIKGLLADLQALAHDDASQLSEVIPFGVAFHHGGLLAEERDLIETAFRRKHIRVLCCTSTLAAGVNLPARRVVIKTPYVGREFLTKSRYLQMCGRAGRAGLDPYGESYLLLSSRDQTRGHALMHGSVEPCCSQLLEDDETLTRSLLECVGVGLVADHESACRWTDSLLSRWAVGPVDMIWQPHIAAVAAPVSPAKATSAPPAEAATATCDSATGVSLTSRVAREDGADGAQDSESSRSAPGPSAPPPSHPVSPTSPPLTCVPPAAMHAMVCTSLIKLARCGLVRIFDTRSVAGVAAVRHNNISLATGTRTCTGSGGGGGAAATDGKNFDAASSAAVEALLSSAFSDGGHADGAAETRGTCPMQVHVTPFGSSSVRSCFSVEEALLLRDELDELQHTGLVLSDDLHLCYFLTPLWEVGKCDWELLRLMMSRMSDSRQRIASLLGVDAYFIDQQAMGLGGPLEASEEGRRRLFTAKRFYVAMMLADVLAEVPMATVEQRYNVSRGQLQSLMRSASMFSSSITSFCHAMEWFSLEAVLASFVKRLGFGVKPDLLPLMEIRGMQPSRARALWNAGFKKLATIAAADADDMVSKVKAMNPKDAKAAKFFAKRSALMVIRGANLALQSKIREKKDELQELTARCGRGGGGFRGVSLGGGGHGERK